VRRRRHAHRLSGTRDEQREDHVKLKLWIATIVASGMSLSGVGAAGAADATSGGVSDRDAAFLRQAAVIGMFEIDSSAAASPKADDAQIQAFAQRMITEHSAQAADLQALAGSLGVSLPARLPGDEAAKLAGLSPLSGGDLDWGYLALQIRGHADAIGVFQTEAASGDDPAVKAWAAKYVPALIDHLDHATMAWADRFRGSSLVSSAVISAWTDAMITQPPTKTTTA
jgi:putative membrane protein